MSETIYNYSRDTVAQPSFLNAFWQIFDMMSLSRRHHGEHYVIFLLWYLQTGSSAVTFLCAKVHFHSGVSPGVQDLPGNDADDRHPERHGGKKRGYVMIALPCNMYCAWHWKYGSSFDSYIAYVSFRLSRKRGRKNNGGREISWVKRFIFTLRTHTHTQTENNLSKGTRNNITADSLWKSKLGCVTHIYKHTHTHTHTLQLLGLQ